jgi:hypothetical protein
MSVSRLNGVRTAAETASNIGTTGHGWVRSSSSVGVRLEPGGLRQRGPPKDGSGRSDDELLDEVPHGGVVGVGEIGLQ